MKRSSSEKSASSDDEESKPKLEPTTPPPKTGKSKSSSASPSKKAKKESKGSGQVNGGWTPEKKAMFMDTIIANGYKSTNLEELSVKVSLRVLERSYTF